MILLDAMALVALLRDEPAAQRVEGLLHSGRAAITSATLAEAIDVSVRRLGASLSEVEAAVGPLIESTLAVLSLGESEARRAATIRITQYHRTNAPISLGDCLLLGSALATGATIATADTLMVRIANREGVTVELLSNRREEG